MDFEGSTRRARSHFANPPACARADPGDGIAAKAGSLLDQSPPNICIVSRAEPDGRVKASQSMVRVKGELIESLDLL